MTVATVRAPGAPLTAAIRAEVCREHEDCHVHIGEGTTQVEVHAEHDAEVDCTAQCHLEEQTWRWESHASAAAHHACRMGDWATADGTVVHLEDRTGDAPQLVTWTRMCADCHDLFHGPHSHPEASEALAACDGCAEHVTACPSRACRRLAD